MAQGRGNFDDTNNATTASATTEASSPVPETTTEDIFAELEVIIGSLSTAWETISVRFPRRNN